VDPGRALPEIGLEIYRRFFWTTAAISCIITPVSFGTVECSRQKISVKSKINYKAEQMAIYNEVQLQRIFIGKLKHGSDLLEELTSVCEHNDIHLDRVGALGAVKKARLGFYNQQNRKYEFYDIEENLEITNLFGNISM
jgi:hypothetical protein